MNNGNIRTLLILAIPLALVLSFFISTTALVEGASVEMSEWGRGSNGSLVESVINRGLLNSQFTSAVTGSLTITGVVVSDIGMTSAVVSWTTDEDSDSLVRYGTGSDSLTLSATNPATGTDHAVPLANLTPNTQYFLEVESAAGDGDTAVDDNFGSLHTFTTLGADLKRKAFVGTVAGEPGETVTLLQKGNKGELTIILPEDYTLKTPGGPRAGAFEDGARVVILTQRAGEQWIALRVLVKPVKPNLPVLGVITGVGATSVTILDHTGNPHLLKLGGLADFPEEGEVVTLFPGNSGQARGLVKAEDVRKRMHKFLEEATEGEAGDTIGKNLKGKRTDALIKRLEKHGAERIRLLDNAIQHAPADIRKRIEAWKAKAQRGIESSGPAVNKARGKSKKPGLAEDVRESAESGSLVEIDGDTGQPPTLEGDRGKSRVQGNNRGQGSGKGQDRDDKPGNKGKKGKGDS